MFMILNDSSSKYLPDLSKTETNSWHGEIGEISRPSLIPRAGLEKRR